MPFFGPTTLAAPSASTARAGSFPAGALQAASTRPRVARAVGRNGQRSYFRPLAGHVRPGISLPGWRVRTRPGSSPGEAVVRAAAAWTDTLDGAGPQRLYRPDRHASRLVVRGSWYSSPANRSDVNQYQR